jgi:hypothetical protein
MIRPTRTDHAGRAYLDLQNQARRQHRGTQDLLTLYVLERFLARLVDSPHASQFVLKGGMLLAALSARRPTVDIDLNRIAEIAALPSQPDDGSASVSTVQQFDATPIKLGDSGGRWWWAGQGGC